MYEPLLVEGAPVPSESDWKEMKKEHKEEMDCWTCSTVAWLLIECLLGLFVFNCNTILCPDHQPQFTRCVCKSDPLEVPNEYHWCMNDQRCVENYYCSPLNATKGWSMECVYNHRDVHVMSLSLILVVIPIVACWPCKAWRMHRLRQCIDGY